MLLRAVTALKQKNSGVIVDVAQPTKVVSRSQVRTLTGHFIGSKICNLEQNIWWGIGLRAVMALKQNNSGVIIVFNTDTTAVRLPDNTTTIKLT